MEARQRVLIVEDDKDVREMVGEWLGKHLSVSLAEDGAQALKLIDGHRREFDVIVLDLELPDMAGESLVRELRSQHIGAPVLIVSGADGAKSKAREVDAEFISKPFDIHRLEEKVRQLLERRSGAVIGKIGRRPTRPS
jgi:DNA-binding response OmpR family regulator